MPFPMKQDTYNVTRTGGALNFRQANKKKKKRGISYIDPRSTHRPELNSIIPLSH